MRIILAVCLSIFLIGCATSQSPDDLGYEGHKKSESGKSRALETLERLQADPDVSFRTEREWTVANKNTADEKAVWSFPPETHEAYPSVVKRKVVEDDGIVRLVTTVSCGSTKVICDRLVRDFIQLNENVRREVICAPQLR